MNQSGLLLRLIFTASFSFIVGIFLCNYYSINHRIITIQQVNDSILIEQALQQTRICTPTDRARQHSMLTTLLAWTRFARKYNIRYWITYGTLIGYVQHRGILPHDADVDIMMMEEGTSKLASLVNSSSTAFDTNLYELKVHPQWKIVGWAGRSYFRSQGFPFIAPNARFINKKTKKIIDIYPIYDYHPKKAKNASQIPMLTYYDNSYKWMSTPMNWTFPLRPCQLNTLDVWCPAEPQKLVAAVYGQTAVTLSHKVCINGAWTGSNDYAFAHKNRVPAKSGKR